MKLTKATCRRLRKSTGKFLKHPVIAGLVTAGIIASAAYAVHLTNDPPPPRNPGSGPWPRTVFTCAEPAPCVGTEFVTFNANIGNPGYGDERNFLLVKPCGELKSGGFLDTMRARSGDCVMFRIIVDNAAANEAATNTRVAISPGDASAVNSFIKGWVCADNANPRCIWDEVRLDGASDQPFRAVYVKGSGRIYSNAHPDTGVKVDRFLDSSGALVSENLPLDGKVFPAYKGSLIVTGHLRIIDPVQPS